jgi:cobalt/nickel transport protein
MKKGYFVGVVLSVGMFILSLAAAGPAAAHFGMVIPSDEMVMQGENTNINVDLMFWHPFEGHGMELVKPAKFAVVANGEKEDLLGSLKSTNTKGHQTWSSSYKVKRPGVYMFYIEPQPYWEPAEDCYIVHYTKTVVTAFGDDPVPYAEVEVEYYNKDGQFSAPTDYMVTQTVKADGNGVFTYVAPKAGWWGFAALNTSDTKKKYQGEEKDIELGAVLWVKFHDMK